MDTTSRDRKETQAAWTSTHDDRLRAIKFALLKRQVPVLYAVVATAALITCAAHYGTAPDWLCLWLPAPLVLVVVARLFMWLRLTQKLGDPECIRKRLRTTLRLATVQSVLFTAWGILLLQYGQGLQPAVTVAFILITSFGAAFCLSAYANAAFRVLITSGVPFSLALAATGQPHLLAVAGIFALVTALTVRMIYQYQDDLGVLVGRQIALEEKHAEAQRAYELANGYAYSDPLTGLGNRRNLLLTLETKLARMADGQAPFAIALMDLDRFKMINDVYGHTGGDTLLREIGSRLSRTMVPGASAYRLGGDEFAIIVPCETGSKGALEFLRRIGRTIEDPYQIAGSTCLVKTSCGFCVSPGDVNGPEALLDKADKALTEAKLTRAVEPMEFTPALHAVAQRHAHVEQALRRALTEDAIDVKFQPIVRLGDETVAGFEALARWEDQSLGMVSPGEFIPVAEQAGLMDQITFALLEKAILHAATWPEDIYLSFNLSAIDVMRTSTPLRLLAAAADHGVDPRRIVVEITETALMHDLETASQTLAQLHVAGVKVALDDFGTGHASLSNLHDLSLDVLKIDRTFIANLTTSEKSRVVVEAMVGMCRALGLPAIAEGIETSEQLEALRKLGCERGQGFLFGRAMPASEAWEMVCGEDAAGRPVRATAR